MTAVAEKSVVHLVAPADETRSHRRRERAVTALAYVAMVLVLLVVALPLYWIVVTSFKERPDIYTLPVTWWPRQMSRMGALPMSSFTVSTT